MSDRPLPADPIGLTEVIVAAVVGTAACFAVYRLLTWPFRAWLNR